MNDRHQLLEALNACGVGLGDNIYVHSQIFTLAGVLKSTNKSELMCDFYSALRSTIGETGNIAVPTFTMSLGRSREPFVVNETPSEVGVFSEYMRSRKSSIRTLHPINSVVVEGPDAIAITNNLSRTNYGANSVYDRMLSYSFKAVNIGFVNRYSNSWHHQAEAVIGSPYLYTKVLRIPVSRCQNSAELGPFFGTFRYLDFNIENDMTRFDQELIENGVIQSVSLGKGKVSSVPAEKYLNSALKALSQDPWCFLKAMPTFIPNKIPMD